MLEFSSTVLPAPSLYLHIAQNKQKREPGFVNLCNIQPRKIRGSSLRVGYGQKT